MELVDNVVKNESITFRLNNHVVRNLRHEAKQKNIILLNISSSTSSGPLPTC